MFLGKKHIYACMIICLLFFVTLLSYSYIYSQRVLWEYSGHTIEIMGNDSKAIHNVLDNLKNIEPLSDELKDDILFLRLESIYKPVSNISIDGYIVRLYHNGNNTFDDYIDIYKDDKRLYRFDLINENSALEKINCMYVIFEKYFCNFI